MSGLSYLLILAAGLGLIAVTVAVVTTIRRRLRQQQSLRTDVSSRVEAAAGPVVRHTDVPAERQDALGWAAKGTANGSDASFDESEMKQGLVSGRGKTVMVADDDPVVLYAITRRLQQMGFNVMRSPDASHALLGAMKVLPDLIILDINMPAGNGLAVCEMMACDQRSANIPVIIHSCLTDDAVKRRCQRLGAHYVEKSSHSWKEIKALVESLIGDHKEVVIPAAVDDNTAWPEQQTPAGVSRQGAPSRPQAAVRPTTGRRLVLCLESPQGRLEPIEHKMLALGIEVNRTSDREEGFWTCFTEKPIAIVAQIADDKKGLLALLARLAQHPVTRSIPVFVINENDLLAQSDVPTGLKAKIMGHPVDWEGLLCELEQYLPEFHHDELTSPPTVAPSPAAQPANDASDKPITVLCIDDDPVVAKSIANRLQQYKIQVKAAYDGTQGFMMAMSEKPSVILLDLKMPNGEGKYTLGKLKTTERTKDIPVIVLTMETLAGVRRHVFSIGADAFLSKPIRWPELFTEMERCVHLPKELLRDYKIPEQLTLAEI